MERISLKDAIKQVLLQRGTEMFYGDIALQISNFVGFQDENIENLKKRISKVLSNEVRKKGGVFARVPNGKKNKGKTSYKKGVYVYKSIKNQKLIIDVDKPHKPQTRKNNQQLEIFGNKQAKLSFKNPFEGIGKDYYGSGGEFAVASELLFRGFNTNMMTIDDGIDIIASKNKSFYFIQVKTRTWNDGYASVQIDIKSYERYNNNNVYYIIVIRYMKNATPHNTYLVLPTAIIDKGIIDGTISKGTKDYILNIKQDASSIMLCGKNSKGEEVRENINAYINNFDCIK